MPLYTTLLCLLCLTVGSLSASGAPSGLNTIPTTDIAPFHNGIAQVQNGNTSLVTPALYSAPHFIYQTQFGLTPRIEAGADWIQPSGDAHDELSFNVKDLLLDEDDVRPNAAIGLLNAGNNQRLNYYLTLSKTLNYAEEQRERFRAHHRRNRKLLGRRVHLGLLWNGGTGVEPFLGTDLQLNDNSVFQADWISGAGNAITFGMVYVLPSQKDVLNPAFLFSNDKHRVDGFFINYSHQFSF